MAVTANIQASPQGQRDLLTTTIGFRPVPFPGTMITPKLLTVILIPLEPSLTTPLLQDVGDVLLIQTAPGDTARAAAV